VPVASSTIAAVGYDGGTLTVAFHGGHKDRYRHRSLKGTYPVERVEVD
jgi:hypothetical protein